MKRKLSIFALVMLMCLSAVMVACQPEGNKITIDAPAELTMSVYDTKELNYTASGYEGELTYASSDSTVVEVRGSTLYALKEGTATVVVTAGEVTKDIAVTVTAATNAPAISVPTTNVRIVAETEFAFAPAIKMGENTVEGELTVNVADQTVATYANGKINGLKVGSTTLTVSGTYFGTNLRPVTVTVTVIPDLIVSLSAQEVTLYTYAPAGEEETYPASETVTVTVEEKGEIVNNPAITWSIDKNNAVATVNNGVIAAVAEGTATVTVKYKTVDAEIAVTVEKTLLEADTAYAEYDLNAKDDTNDYLVFDIGEDIPLADVTGVYDFTGGNKEIIDFETDAASEELRLTKADILDGERVIVVETATYGKSFEALMATKFLYTAEDLEEMMVLATEGYEVKNAQSPGRSFYQGADGYYVLMNDIDFGSKTFRLTGEESDFGFIGTLDGRGHVISNVNKLANGNGTHGMFGRISGTIKNIGFVNVVGSYNNTNTNTNQNLWGRFPLLGTINSNGLVENVYVKGARTALMNSVWGQGAIGQYRNGHINNLVVDMSDVVTNLSDNGGNKPGAAIGQLVNQPAPAEGYIKNVYSVSSYDVVGIGPGSRYLNVKGYQTVADFAAAENDYSSFENEWWDLSSGIPVFKALVDDMKNEEFAITNGDLLTAGSETTLTTDSEWEITFALENEVAGVTLDGNVLSVAATAAHNATVTVTATNLKTPTNSVVKTFTVLNIGKGGEATDIDLSDEAASYEIEMVKAIVPETISAGSATLTPANYSVNGTKLTLTAAGVTEILEENNKKYGDFELLIVDEDGAAYSIELAIVTMILYDKEDALAMMPAATDDFGYEAVGGLANSTPTETQAAQRRFYNGADGYFVLAADIDMEGEILRFCHQDYDFKGILDGRGHKISNIGSYEYPLLNGAGTAVLANADHGIFGNIAGTVRNIAFVNVVGGNDTASPYNPKSTRSVALALRIKGGLVENVYVSYTAKETGGWGCGAFGIFDWGSAKIVNFVAERTNYAGTSFGANDGVINGVGTSSKVTNVFGICSAQGATTKQGTLYASYDAMKEAELDLSGFDSAYWDISAGYPVFKACKTQA
ncbi:MAG: hypothetical protein DBX59_11005 [Bacillota bacterium]|nr:MAG: hypothetical protein DBX59_11005 [Bacillota bacterium]